MGYTEAEYEVLAKYKATKHDTETVLIVKHRRNETEGSKDDHNYLALVGLPHSLHHTACDQYLKRILG